MTAGRTNPPPIALTSGDPAGIGPDITLKSWLARNQEALPPFALLADPELLVERSRIMGFDVPCRILSDIAEAPEVFPRALPILPIPLGTNVRPACPDVAAAGAIIRSIEEAVRLTVEGKARALTTNPIAKHVLLSAGFQHPGHTEFLGALARRHGAEASPVMMLSSSELRVVPVTVHIALARVPSELTTELIVETARVTAAGLTRWFGIGRPRLALAGLNPHAGESGAMGTEEQTIIAPALEILRQEARFEVTGPHPADTMFHARARQAYDAALAMYHDQALIPIKTIAFDEGVNVTLGLPFIRTSPDHGTAFDIAGTGAARPDSLIAALRLAAGMAERDSKPARHAV